MAKYAYFGDSHVSLREDGNVHLSVRVIKPDGTATAHVIACHRTGIPASMAKVIHDVIVHDRHQFGADKEQTAIYSLVLDYMGVDIHAPPAL